MNRSARVSSNEVLVVGATGFVGRNLVPELIERGHEVVAMTRNASTYDPPEGVSVVEADLNDRESLRGVFDGVDAAYYLVHSMGESEDFMAHDRVAARNFVSAARGSKLSRVVYLSGLGGERVTLSDHLKSRREVEYILGTGAYDLTVLRAAIVIGGDSASFRMVRQLAERLPLMITPRWVRTNCQPIAIEDVVGYLVGVLDTPETAGETYEIGGPDVLTYGEMVIRTGDLLDKRATMVPVPVLSPQLSAYWVDLVTDVPKVVAHPLILGLKTRTVVEDDRIRSLVPIELTPFDDAVRRAIA
ncbi:NADH-binding protein [Haladaptatus sp. R4]|uniref:NAD(P)H-binding protein n=1 Tax=Haladaptatus sp. R4 TaxID=1679489 RepID=UPI0007B4C286|nr:NAD(P)H-binding protein [Haladaptatus sp. R4]KZN26089.1 NADH-binding protein [Haladaptatus sp. R4]